MLSRIYQNSEYSVWIKFKIDTQTHTHTRTRTHTSWNFKKVHKECKSYEPFVAYCLGYSINHKVLHSNPNHILLTYCILCACYYPNNRQTFSCKKLTHEFCNGETVCLLRGTTLICKYDSVWCFSDRASWIDYILITNFCALIIIYS